MYQFLIVLLLSIFSFVSHANPQPDLKFTIIKKEFALDSNNIYRAEIVEENGIYRGLHIQLKPDAQIKFTRLTLNNKRKTINFIFGNKILSSSVITGPLSGDLLMAGIARDDAVAILQSLNTELKKSEEHT